MERLILPEPVKRALERLHAAGYEGYVVGGAVRDALAGRGPAADWDVTTDALPEQVAALFSDCPVIPTGWKHGTVTLLTEGVPVEITTYRVDGDYSDARHPDAVRFTRSIDEDLSRRDFTVNAIAYDPRRGLRDPFRGEDDLRAGILRCVGRPERRFAEDALRILRALRFAAVFGMEIETNTAAAIHAEAAQLRRVAAERIQAELTRLLCGDSAGAVLRAFSDVAAVLIPELAPAFGFDQRNPHHDRDVWEHTLAVIDAAPPDGVLRWAALLHDLGKPACFTVGPDGVGHFYGHAAVSERMARGILSRLRFDRRRMERITALVLRHDAPVIPERGPMLRLLRRMGEEDARALIALSRADTLGQAPMCRERLAGLDRAEALLDELREERACFSLKDLAVNGRDALEAGLSGPEIRRALEACLDAVTEGRAPNERDALLPLLRRER